MRTRGPNQGQDAPSGDGRRKIGRLGKAIGLGGLGLVGGIGASAALLTGSANAGPTCTKSWNSAVSGAWTDATKWTPAIVPSSGDDVCINLAGTYAVTLNGSGTANSLTLGGAAGAQTLSIAGTAPANANLSLATPSKVLASGRLVMDSSSAGAFSLIQGAGPLTVVGRFTTVQNAGNTRYIRIPIDNQGTLEIGAASSLNDGGTTLTNSTGSLNVVSSGALDVNNSTFVSSGGSVSVASGGALRLTGSTFTLAGGALTGTPVQLSGSTLNDSAGTGVVNLVASDTLSGTIPAGQTVNILGTAPANASVTLSGTVVNNGTLALDSQSSGAFALMQSGALTNNGLLHTVQGGGNVRYLRSAVTNTPSGTIQIGAAGTIQDSGGSTVNQGALVVDAGGAEDVSGTSITTQPGSTISVAGSLSVSGGTFNAAGGAFTGNPIVLSGSTLNDSAGTGAFDLVSSDTLSGTIPAGQTVRVLGTAPANASTTLGAPSVTNNGTLVLDSTASGAFSLVQGNTLLNNGALKVLQGAGNARYLRIPITNAAGGTFEISSSTAFQDVSTATINDGLFTLLDGANLSVSGGSFTNNAGGTIAVTVNAITGVSKITGGTTVNLDGTLKVTTIGSPAVGTVFTPISVTSRVGTFTTLRYGTAAYATAYSPTTVTLTAATPFILKGKAVTGVEDTPLKNVTVATVTNGSLAGTTYTATIDWGDGSPSTPGTVVTTGTGAIVKGTHTYAAPGTFTVTTTVFGSTGTVITKTSAATISPAPVPTVTAVSPGVIGRGGAITFTLTGTGFTSDAAVTFSAAGMTASTFTYISPTSVKIKGTASATATLGAGNVVVTTDGGVGTCTGCLTVNPGPKITTAGPNQARGVTTVVTVTGTGFVPGLTVTSTIPGATLGTPTSVTATSFTIAVTVPAGAPVGTYKLTVVNPDGGKVTKTCLTVV